MLYTPLDYFKTGTDPQTIYGQTGAQIIITNKPFMTSEEFTKTLQKPKEENLAPFESETAVRSPKLEYEYDFYNKQSGHLSRCKTKKVKIDFTTETTSQFEFNYKEETFKYTISLYNDLYLFSDELKGQDCYFRGENYSEGYLKDPYNNNFIKAIAKDFVELRQYNYTNDQIAEIATIFAQSITYGTDETSSNRYPYETIFEKEGNCLDKSIILVGILKELGYEPYLILGLSEEYHALVGIVCEKGNIQYNGKEICFAETTVFTPIGSNVKIEIEQVLKVANGDRVYREDSYGPKLVKLFDVKEKENNLTILKIENYEPESKEIEAEMCRTDCVICDGDSINPEKTKEEIESCWDAEEYNKLVEKYNNLIINHNNFVQEWYDNYYELEKSMFGNIELISRTEQI